MIAALAAPAEAARVSVDLEADRIEVGQRTRLVIQVVDGVPTAIPAVEVGAGLTIRYLGQSDRVLRGTQGKRLLELGWEIEAIQVGSWGVGPVRIEVGTELVQVGPVTVTVAEAIAPDARPIAAAEAEFTPTEAWEGQVVVYRYALRSRTPILRSRWTLPPMTGLLPPRDGDRPRSEAQLEGPDGLVFLDVSWVPLVTTRSGTLDQKMAVVDVELGAIGGHGPARDVLAAGSAPLLVRPLPTPPSGFSGIVGDVVVSSGLLSGAAEVGEAVAWTVRIRGDGALDGVTFPPLPDGLALSSYDDTPVGRGQVVGGRYEAEVELKRTLVPTAPGVIVVPDLAVVAFSPSRGVYVSHPLLGGTLEVGGAKVAPTVERFGSGRAEAIDGPRPLVARAISLDLPGGYPAWWAAAVAPGALALVWRSWPRRRPARAEDDPYGEARLLDRLGGVSRDGRDAALAALPPEVSRAVRAAFLAVDVARYGDGDPEAARRAVRAALDALPERRP